MIDYIYIVMRNIIRILVCKILFRVKYENSEILEAYDKCMICANHSRIFDPIFLYPGIPNMYSVAKSDLFEKRIIASFLRFHNAIPIKRNARDIKGTKNIIDTLNTHEKIRLLIFPEGGIFKENYIENKRKTKNGAMYISATANVPIIPVHITVRPKFFSKVVVSFGEPVFPNLEVLKDRNFLREESSRLINQIYKVGV